MVGACALIHLWRPPSRLSCSHETKASAAFGNARRIASHSELIHPYQGGFMTTRVMLGIGCSWTNASHGAITVVVLEVLALLGGRKMKKLEAELNKERRR